MNGSLSGLLADFSGWIWEASWQAGVIALVVLIVRRLTGSRLSPGWRYGLWLLVVVRLLMPVLPESRTSLYNFTPQFRTSAPITPTAEVLSVPISGEKIDVKDKVLPSPVVVKKPTRPSLGTVLTFVWLVGVLLYAVRLIMAHRTFQRRAGCRNSPADPIVLSLLKECAATMNVRPPHLVESDAVDAPALTGLFTPAIFFPSGISTRFSAEEIRHVMLHELAHLKRGDVAVNWMTTVLQILHWFNPVLWIAFRRMRADREIACDEMVLRNQGLNKRQAYGQTLIKVLEEIHHGPAKTGMVGILEDGNLLKRRIAEIVRHPGTSRLAVVIGAVVFLAICALGLTRATGRSPNQKEIANTCLDSLNRIESIRYNVRGYNKTNHSPSFEMDWWEMRGKCRYKYRQLNAMGDQDFSSGYGYDGETYTRTSSSPNTIYTKRGFWPFPPWIRNMYFITSPFDFLIQRTGVDPWSQPNLQLLKTAEAWEHFLKCAEMIGRENFHGRDCVAVRVRGGRDRFIEDLDTYYVVYFDCKMGWMPAGWKEYDLENRLLAELEVLDVAKVPDHLGDFVCLPRKLKVSFFAVNNKRVYEQPTNYQHYEFGGISLDSLEDFDFALDVTLVKNIFDEDKNQFSQAPAQSFNNLILPDLKIEKERLSILLPMIGNLAKKSDPAGKGFTFAFAISPGNEPLVTLIMKRPTVAQVLAEIVSQTGMKMTQEIKGCVSFQPGKEGVPYGTPVPNKPGFVTSPHNPDAGYVDVHGLKSGTQIQCPYTKKPFLVP